MKNGSSLTIHFKLGRSTRIRTLDPLVPNQVRYRTAPHSEDKHNTRFIRDGQLKIEIRTLFFAKNISSCIRRPPSQNVLPMRVCRRINANFSNIKWSKITATFHIDNFSMSNTFNWNVRVYYEDTDAGGVVFYASYLKFLERSRTEWLRATGVSRQDMADLNVMFVVTNVTIDYLTAAKLDDELKLTLTVLKLRHASVEFLQQVWRDSELLTSASVKVACVDVQNIRPCVLPPMIWEKLSAFLK